MGAVYEERIGGEENLGASIPDIGARSAIDSWEYLADAIANLATGHFDLSTPEQVTRSEIVAGLLWDLINEKFNH